MADLQETDLIGMDAVRAAVPSLNWLAGMIGVTRSAVCQWDEVPLRRLVDVARITNLPISVLRPDLFADDLPHEVVR